MRLVLTIVDGPHRGATFTATATADAPLIIGRGSDANVCLTKDPVLSRAHCLIEVQPVGARLLDLNSRNGTYLNHQPIKQAKLHDGDVLHFGKSAGFVLIEMEEPALPPTRVGSATAVLGDAGSESDASLTLTNLPNFTRGETRAPQPVSPTHPVPPTAEFAFQADEPAPPSESNESFETLDASMTMILSNNSALKAMLESALAEKEAQKAQAEPTKNQTAPTPAKIPATLPPTAMTAESTYWQNGDPEKTPFLPSPKRATAGPSTPLPSPAHGPPPVLAAQDRIGGYRLQKLLGRGGMGMVYLATTEHPGEEVALKIIIPQPGTKPEEIDRFLREMQVLQQLDHPNIVKFLEAGSERGILYLAMEYIAGKSAEQLVQQHGGRLPIVPAVRLLCQALRGLAHAHTREIVHRDIKPTNIFIRQQNGKLQAKVGDFGLARICRPSNLQQLTQTGQIGGTLPFMAPEQILSFRNVQPAADQYAAAATLYYLLTGHYTHDYPEGILERVETVLNSPPMPIRLRRSEVPRGLESVLTKALDRKPENRFVGVVELREALLPFGNTPAPPPPKKYLDEL